MEQTKEQEPIKDVSHPDYDPGKDPEVEDSFSDWADNIRERLMPYHKYIMIVGFTILILLVVFLGYARGALDICNDLGGRFEIDNIVKVKCVPGQDIPTSNILDPRLSIPLPIFNQNGT